MPEGPGALPAGFQEDLFSKIPDIPRTPDSGEEVAQRQGFDERFEALFGHRVSIVDMRLLRGASEHSGCMGAMVFHGPVIRFTTARQLLLVQKPLDQHGAIFMKSPAYRVLHERPPGPFFL
ncbi:hypothetical protein D3C80_1351660 [compost metagenome]